MFIDYKIIALYCLHCSSGCEEKEGKKTDLEEDLLEEDEEEDDDEENEQVEVCNVMFISKLMDISLFDVLSLK